MYTQGEIVQKMPFCDGMKNSKILSILQLSTLTFLPCRERISFERVPTYFRDLPRVFSGRVPICKFKWSSPMTPPTTDPHLTKKTHLTICTDARGMALRHSVIIESRNAVKTCFCLHILWKDLGTNKFLAVSGQVPGTPCWNLTGSQEPVEPVLVRSLWIRRSSYWNHIPVPMDSSKWDRCSTAKLTSSA